MDFLEIADRTWPVIRRVTSVHTTLYRATNGRLGHHVPGAPAMLLLDHVGARTGARRTTPLVYTTDGDNLVIVASKGGHPQHPAWYHNLRAHPDTIVQLGDERRAVRARVAEPIERARLWPLVVRTYAGFETYQKRTGREIPLVVLERR
ncbi:MAG TPA: nitroreductase family deazaflavin-dependent oxidoreductase [Pseudonocardia sp.]